MAVAGFRKPIPRPPRHGHRFLGCVVRAQNYIINTETGVIHGSHHQRSGIYDSVSIVPVSAGFFSKEGCKQTVRDGVTLDVGVLGLTRS
jgi:hypothetical protein